MKSHFVFTPRMIIFRLLQAWMLYAIAKFIYNLKWELILKYWQTTDKFPYLPKFVEAIFLTLQLTVLSLAIGFIIALPLALLRAKRSPEWAAILADGFVAVFRGSPLLVQMYLVYYGIASFEFVRESFLWFAFKDAYFCVVFTFSLNAAAYACEIIRGALVNGGKGEREAAKSLGLSVWQVDWLVWIPAALRRALPQYGNEFIFMMHGTAIAGLVTLTEVFGLSREINARHYVTYEGILMAAIIYIVLTAIIVQLSKWLERRYLSFNKR